MRLDRLKSDAGKLHDALDRYGIANSFEVYPGTHTSKVADRFQNHVMKFFRESLCFEGAAGKKATVVIIVAELEA